MSCTASGGRRWRRPAARVRATRRGPGKPAAPAAPVPAARAGDGMRPQRAPPPRSGVRVSPRICAPSVLLPQPDSPTRPSPRHDPPSATPATAAAGADVQASCARPCSACDVADFQEGITLMRPAPAPIRAHAAPDWPSAPSRPPWPPARADRHGVGQRHGRRSLQLAHQGRRAAGDGAQPHPRHHARRLRDASHQAARVGVAGRAEDGRRRPLHDLPGIHHRHAVARAGDHARGRA